MNAKLEVLNSTLKTLQEQSGKSYEAWAAEQTAVAKEVIDYILGSDTAWELSIRSYTYDSEIDMTFTNVNGDRLYIKFDRETSKLSSYSVSGMSDNRVTDISRTMEYYNTVSILLNRNVDLITGYTAAMKKHQVMIDMLSETYKADSAKVCATEQMIKEAHDAEKSDLISTLYVDGQSFVELRSLGYHLADTTGQNGFYMARVEKIKAKSIDLKYYMVRRAADGTYSIERSYNEKTIWLRNNNLVDGLDSGHGRQKGWERWVPCNGTHEVVPTGEIKLSQAMIDLYQANDRHMTAEVKALIK